MSAQASAPGQVFVRESHEHAGGMKLRTGYANQRHGKNCVRAGDCAQRQFGSPNRRVGLRCGFPAAGSFRSGSAWLGRSQKDGLPARRGQTWSY
jgi:hypothetical protein